jgi:hypothetical protein
MSEHLYLLSIGLVPGTVLLIYGMKYYAAVQQAKARLANDEAYRRIAERSAAAESETATALVAIQAALADVRASLGTVEKILKAVE